MVHTIQTVKAKKKVQPLTVVLLLTLPGLSRKIAASGRNHSKVILQVFKVLGCVAKASGKTRHCKASAVHRHSSSAACYATGLESYPAQASTR